ncbi:MAG TPA: hypothetical protein PLH19_04610 [Anaerolineae bacterium]|nr:hypothetical protein [Anaerolineae bacterium]HQH37804.1 hypothetical protein [Anaerolineae bacterium]
MTIVTTTLTTYRGVIEKDGIVRLRQSPPLPIGTEVLVVAAQPLPSLEEQRHRLAALSPEEWRKPFDAVRVAWDTSEPAPDEDALPSDGELVELVHKVQQEGA